MTSPGNSPSEPTRAGAACPGGPGLLAGRTVARVGYGAMQLRNLRHDRDAAIALLRRAVELRQAGREDRFRFGREADGSPARPWSWGDLD